jgi:hypothetical protein
MSATAEATPPNPATRSRASETERWALVERVAYSNCLKRSARLRDFLLYVGRQSLQNGAAELNEQEIGEKVFGRPASYDRSQDNIVRVNASELRKRIDLYFNTEGAEEPLVLEIPRGGYKPVFHLRETPVPETASVGLERPPVAHPVQSEADSKAADASAGSGAESGSVSGLKTRAWLHSLWAAATAALAVTCVALWIQNREMRASTSPWEGKPAVAAFWSGYLHDHQQTDIVLPDDSVSVIQDVIHRPITLDDYVSRDYMRAVEDSQSSPERKMDLNQIFSHNLITFGGVRAAQMMLQEMPPAPQPHLTLSRYYTADAMKRNNVILVGGMKANPWVHLFDDRMNFITDYDHAHGHAFITNAHPQAGEQPIYTAPLYPNSLTGYAVVAYLPNPSHTANIIILAGMDSDATSAAAEFLTSETQLERLLGAIHAKEFPYFEVLLKNSRVSGTSFSADIVAYRTYPLH